jgi:hypothetical protein
VAINKNFVVKNGLEVASNLLVANSLINKVGLGTTTPRTLLDVRGGFISTDSYVSGISTVESTFYVRSGTNNTLTALGVGGSVGVGTALPGYLLDVRSPVSTGQTALYIQGDARVTGNVNIGGDVTLDEVTVRNINISGITTSNYLNVTGFGTISSLFVPGTASIQTGIVTFISGTNLNYSGIVTANSISIGSTQVISNTRQLQNIVSFDATTTATIEAAISNAPNTFSDLNVTGFSTLRAVSAGNIIFAGIATGLNVSGVGTITNIQGTNLNVSGVGTIATLNSTYSTITNENATNLNVSGIGTIATLNSTYSTITNENATNLNVSGIATFGNLKIVSGIITASVGVITYYGDGSNLTGLAGLPTLQTVLNVGNASNTGMSISGVSTLTTLLGTNLNYSGVGTVATLNSTNLNVSGVGTITNIQGTNLNVSGVGTITNIQGTNLNVSGVGTVANIRGTNLNISGIVTATSAIVGSAVTINSTGVNVVGVVTATSAIVGSAVTVNSTGINVVGVVTATSFVGNGSGLTGAGATLNDDTSTASTMYPVFSSSTSGSLTTAKISSTKLTYNPSTGEMTAVNFNSTSDINLKENIKTIENATETIESLRGVSFDWKETGDASYGVIAQELEEVLPELVRKGETKSVNYNGIIGVLIEAVKELKAEIEELKNSK